ncbi:MAG: hypothetical protein HOH94_09615 [Verrucomicrobia bacterium]|nr:hypothetical protein [Verrucomicrobiota bacterium]MBT7215203.1 hypothetical protein [Verrucomicrobiota bacterium]
MKKRANCLALVSSGRGEKSFLEMSKKSGKQSLARSLSGASPQDRQGLLALWGLCAALISARGSAGAAREKCQSSDRYKNR